jgi:Gas vesicle synthesis protein GvpL/GvpF
VSRALAYCAFLHAPETSLPQTGVGSAAVQAMAAGGLRLLWSEVEWPFRAEHAQQYAVEFHGVVSHVFRQRAVVPFRLLSVFEDAATLAGFAAEHQEAFVGDLERLKDVVQMECVVYPSPAAQAARGSPGSGAEYLRERAAVLGSVGRQVDELQAALRELAQEMRVREAKSGTRLFVLAERGREGQFRSIVEGVSVPEQLARRVSGPWPAAEFLSEQVRAPKMAG